MPVVGDFKRLEALARGLAALKGAASKRALHRALSQEGLNQVAECFEGERDPYGRPWKPNRRGGRILRDTGRLLNSRSARVTAAGFELTFAAVYAAIHNFGGTIVPRAGGWLTFPYATQRGGKKRRGGWAKVRSVTIPRRQFVPDAPNLGPIWLPAFQEAAALELARQLRKGSA